MYTTTEFCGNIPAVTVHPEGECFPTIEDALVAVYNEFSDPIDLLNEGAPVCYGNSYAAYEFNALIEGVPYTFSFGPYEYADLSKSSECKLYGTPFDE